MKIIEIIGWALGLLSLFSLFAFMWSVVLGIGIPVIPFMWFTIYIISMLVGAVLIRL